MANTDQFGYWANSSEELLKTQFPMHHACREGDVARLSLLLVEAQHGIYVEDSFYGWTPAHWAAYFGKLECLMCLMEHGVNCDVTTFRFNQTPSHIAAFGARSHCLKWLLHCGATINRQDYLGETPCHKGARTGSMECISLLASHGANLEIPNNNNHIPSQLARMCGFNECGEYLDSIRQTREANKQSLVPPVIQVPQESPMNKVEKCIITQGLNGGLIPTDIVEAHHDTEMMEDDDAGGGDGVHVNGGIQFNGVMNGNGHVTNGFAHNHEHSAVNGFSTHTQHLNGGCDGDVTLVAAISHNRVPVAGKKRAREEFEDSCFKRARQGGLPEPAMEQTNPTPAPWELFGFKSNPNQQDRGRRVMVNEPVFRNTCNGLPVYMNNNGVDEKCVSESAIEHESVLTLQQGYDSMFLDAMVNHHLPGEI